MWKTSPETKRKLAGVTSTHLARQMKLYNGDFGQRFRMSDGAEYEISLKYGFKRIHKSTVTKKERNRAKKFLKTI